MTKIQITTLDSHSNQLNQLDVIADHIYDTRLGGKWETIPPDISPDMD